MHVPSACAPERAGVALLAALSACVHKSLAAWLALHVFVNSSHMKPVMTPMLSAEPWGNDAVVHEREQTYHSTGTCPEPWSTGSKEVSLLPSKPCANLICGVEQLPKLAPEELVLRSLREVPSLARQRRMRPAKATSGVKNTDNATRVTTRGTQLLRIANNSSPNQSIIKV
jgi:hypothetical protein